MKRDSIKNQVFVNKVLSVAELTAMVAALRKQLAEWQERYNRLSTSKGLPPIVNKRTVGLQVTEATRDSDKDAIEVEGSGGAGGAGSSGSSGGGGGGGGDDEDGDSKEPTELKIPSLGDGLSLGGAGGLGSPGVMSPGSSMGFGPGLSDIEREEFESKLGSQSQLIGELEEKVQKQTDSLSQMEKAQGTLEQEVKVRARFRCHRH